MKLRRSYRLAEPSGQRDHGGTARLLLGRRVHIAPAGCSVQTSLKARVLVSLYASIWGCEAKCRRRRHRTCTGCAALRLYRAPLVGFPQFMTSFSRRLLTNQLVIYPQAPRATCLHTFEEWQAYGYPIDKGQVALHTLQQLAWQQTSDETGAREEIMVLVLVPAFDRPQLVPEAIAQPSLPDDALSKAGRTRRQRSCSPSHPRTRDRGVHIRIQDVTPPSQDAGRPLSSPDLALRIN